MNTETKQLFKVNIFRKINQAIQCAKSGDKSGSLKLTEEIESYYHLFDDKFVEKQKEFIHKLKNCYPPPSISYETAPSITNIDDFVTDVTEGISIVTCCMNRNSNLLKALPSWLSHDDVNQIIIIDWNSSTPVNKDLVDHGISDNRILIVRVTDQVRWILSYAFNLGFRVSKFDKILKLDADIVLEQGFFKQHSLAGNIFFAGNWRLTDFEQRFINGCFFIHRENLFAINLFNEYITTYGWDDDDLYARLENRGLQRRILTSEFVHHLPHEDGCRIDIKNDKACAIAELHQDVNFHIQKNKFLTQMMPTWKKGSQRLIPFKINSQFINYLEVQQEDNSAQKIPVHIENDASYYAMLTILSWTKGVRTCSITKNNLFKLLSAKTLQNITTFDIELCSKGDIEGEIYWGDKCLILKSEEANPVKEFIEYVCNTTPIACSFFMSNFLYKNVCLLLDERDMTHCFALPDKFESSLFQMFSFHELKLPDDLKRSETMVINFTPAYKLSNDQRPNLIAKQRRNKLFINVQHGLGNRLRALASASVLAEAADRELILIWAPDEHCNCEIYDLFEYDGEVINHDSNTTLRNTDMYNYMEIGENSNKYGYINLNTTNDIYISSAYTLNNDLTCWEKENTFLRSLIPQNNVRNLVESICANHDIGVHIRMKFETEKKYDSIINWSEESHIELQHWRESSHYSKFIKRVDELIENNNKTLFVASDSKEAYSVFKDKFHGRVSILNREYFDRSKMQLIYALADILLLSKSNYLLGSTWSSFTELAQRFSSTISHVEFSGKDF